MADVVKMVEAVAESVTAVSQEAKQRDAEHNTPKMVQNVEAQREAAAEAKVDQDLAKKDVPALQRDISE